MFGKADAKHIVKWLAHRVQKPQDKINHALVLGGEQGIGKDTILEPVKRAIGPWNFSEASPQQILGRFNGFLKSVILRVSEARDLGDVNRFQFYEHMKAYTASPPDVLRVDEKNLREHSVLNCTGVIFTTNRKDSLYLPADDRRTYVAWSDLTKESFTEEYWADLWRWYDGGGDRHVAAYLAAAGHHGVQPQGAAAEDRRVLGDRRDQPHGGELRTCRPDRLAWRSRTGRHGRPARRRDLGRDHREGHDRRRLLQLARGPQEQPGRSPPDGRVRLRPGAQHSAGGRHLDGVGEEGRRLVEVATSDLRQGKSIAPPAA